MDLARFLAWFEGYSDNIKKQPTPAQWARIKAEIGKIDPSSALPSPLPPASDAAPAAPAKPPKPKTKSAWIAQYRAALVEMGLDEESAKEFADTAEVDLSADPAVSAKTDTAEMMRS